jgi:hypothetical protein
VAVVLGVVIPVAAVAPPAFAAGLNYGTPDASGNYAQCVIAAAPFAGTGFSSLATAQSSAAYLYGATSYTYLTSMSFAVQCDTAFPQSAYSSGGYAFGFNWSGLSQSSNGNGFGEEWTTSISGQCSGCTANGSASYSFTQTSINGVPGGTSMTTPIYCLSSTYFTTSEYLGLSSAQQTSDQIYNCSGTPQCFVNSTAVSGYTLPWTTGLLNPAHSEGCSVQAYYAGSLATFQPSDYWGTQTVSLPAATATVTCSVNLNRTSGVAAFTATATAGANSTLTGQSWNFGDGSTAATVANVNHGYTQTAEPAGGWTATYTATVKGDGTHTQTAAVPVTCSQGVTFVGGTSGAGGGTSPGGGTPAALSCSWLDLLCDLEAAAQWLVVPNSSFYSSWSGFVSNLETKVPFCYPAGVVTWMSSFTGSLYSSTPRGADAPSGNTCLVPANLGPLGVQSSAHACSNDAMALSAVVLGVTTVGFIAVFAVGIYGALRRAIGEH